MDAACPAAGLPPSKEVYGGVRRGMCPACGQVIPLGTRGQVLDHTVDVPEPEPDPEPEPEPVREAPVRQAVNVWTAADGSEQATLVGNISLAVTRYLDAYREVSAAIKAAHDGGVGVTAIARAAGMTRPRVYRSLREPQTEPRRPPE